MRRISEYVQLERYEGSGEDSRGNEVESWAPGVDVGIYAFNPGVTGEPFTPGHERVVTTPTIYAPSTVVVGAHDLITARGTLYEVVGEALDFRNPFGSEMDGISINLKVVDG